MKHSSFESSDLFLRIKDQWYNIIIVMYIMKVHLASLEACSGQRGGKSSSGGSLIFVQEPLGVPSEFCERCCEQYDCVRVKRSPTGKSLFTSASGTYSVGLDG